ncbi:MAG: YoaK family protein [Thermomicrobiales bacterium]
MPETDCAQPLRAMLLVAIAGYVDAYGLLSFGTFVSFMSGNTTQSGAAIGQGIVAAALPGLTAVIFFAIGVFAGAMVSLTAGRIAPRLCLALVAGLIATYMIVAHDAHLGQAPSIAVLALGMGVLNTTASRVGPEPMNIGYVSGTLNRMADHFAYAAIRAPLADARGPGDTHLRRGFVLAGVWSSFFAGAVLSGFATPRFGTAVLVPPLLLVLTILWFTLNHVVAPQSGA